MSASSNKLIYFERMTDIISEGLIVIDEQGYIQIYNQRAREIFNIDPRTGPGHPPGKAEPGDWVILVDNALGKDDGELTPEDFSRIGISPHRVAPGQAVVAIGALGGSINSGTVRAAENAVQRILEMEKTVQGHSFRAELNWEKRLMRVVVDGVPFDYYYQNAAGHLVIVDGKTFTPKFYQMRGYTARGEDAKKILLGKPYMGKGPSAPAFPTEGRHILDIHPDGIGIQHLLQVVKGEKEPFAKKEYEINGIPVRCSVFRLTDRDKPLGGVLVVEDIRELKSLSLERDQALAFMRSMEENLLKQERHPAFSAIAGTSKEIREAIHMAERAARSVSTVLLLGESGTGKGLLARAIHQASSRSTGPFIHVNCAAIPENLLESELFGYDEGAFTGAKRKGKPGKFELAEGGTIFLDEIGDLPVSLQAKLLQVLQERNIYRVGGIESIPINARIIAATNRSLEQLVREGRFREDLYYRLNVLPIIIPPLRNRREDILPLVEVLLPKICNKLEKDVLQLSDEVLKVFFEYDWPGNVRELENVLERAVNMAEGNMVLSIHLPENLREYKKEQKVSSAPRTLVLKEVLDEMEKHVIQEAIRLAKGNRTEAMKLLGIGRTAFYEKMKKHHLE